MVNQLQLIECGERSRRYRICDGRDYFLLQLHHCWVVDDVIHAPKQFQRESDAVRYIELKHQNAAKKILASA